MAARPKRVARAPRRLESWLLAAAFAVLGATVPAIAAAGGLCAGATQSIPAAPTAAEPGSDFARRVAALDGPARDREVRSQLLAGQLPAFLRAAVPVELQARRLGGKLARITLCVLPDYLAIGTDADHLRVPMGLDTALAVAEAFGFTLPTRRIVDAIYAQAALRLAPVPLPPGDRMRSTDYVVRHNAIVGAQRAAEGAALGALTAGDKKDLVLTPRLWSAPGRVAIYGWHREAGRPIQPLSTVHGARYADYSHGVRLVGATVFVDGRPASIFDLLADPRLAPALSDEGPIGGVAALRPLVAAAADADRR